MRKTVLTIAALAALSTPALADMNPTTTGAAVGTGAVVGTAVGVGLYNGWWSASAAGAALPTTVAGSAAVGGVAGVGTVALLDAIIQPCRGFKALIGVNRDVCVNGEYVGHRPVPARYVR